MFVKHKPQPGENAKKIPGALVRYAADDCKLLDILKQSKSSLTVNQIRGIIINRNKYGQLKIHWLTPEIEQVVNITRYLVSHDSVWVSVLSFVHCNNSVNSSRIFRFLELKEVELDC